MEILLVWGVPLFVLFIVALIVLMIDFSKHCDEASEFYYEEQERHKQLEDNARS